MRRVNIPSLRTADDMAFAASPKVELFLGVYQDLLHHGHPIYDAS